MRTISTKGLLCGLLLGTTCGEKKENSLKISEFYKC